MELSRENIKQLVKLPKENIKQLAIGNWIEANVVSNINELVPELFAEEKISPDDFSNYWETPNLDDYDTSEAYWKAVDNPEPQQVYEWYCVTKLAYEFFKMCGDPVAQYKGIYIWGRRSTGQKISVDFINDKTRMDIINKLLSKNTN